MVPVQCCIPENIPIFIPGSTLSSRAMCSISNTALVSSASLSFFYPPRACFPCCASSPLRSYNHLPATLLASFVKRLSRLSLFAPPAAIVMIIPFTYNILKRHPACLAMIHGDSQGFQSGPFSRSRRPFIPFILLAFQIHSTHRNPLPTPRIHCHQPSLAYSPRRSQNPGMLWKISSPTRMGPCVPSGHLSSRSDACVNSCLTLRPKHN